MTSTANMYQGDFDNRFRGGDKQFRGGGWNWQRGPRMEERQREGDWRNDMDRYGRGESFMSRDFPRFPGGGGDFGRDYGLGWEGQDFGRRDFGGRDSGREWGRNYPQGYPSSWDWSGTNFGRGDFGFPNLNLNLGQDLGRDWGLFSAPSDADTGFFGESRRTTAGNTWRNLGKRGVDLPYYAGWWRPRADILEEEGNMRVEFELPGVPKDNISLIVGEDFILVQCVKPESHKERKAYYYQNERHFGNFYRRLDLPSFIDTDSCSAVLQNGVLKVTCWKSIVGGEGGTKTTEGTKRPLKNKINIREMPGQTAPGVNIGQQSSSTTETTTAATTSQ